MFCGNVGGHFSSDDWTDAGGNVFFELCDDCNDNGILDWHDIGEGSSLDCNEDLVPDECHIFVDCNSNGVLDLCDLYSGNSLDCDQDEVPDECQRVVGEFSQIVCGLNQVGKEGTPGTIYPENDMWIPLVGADSDIAFPSLVLMAAEVGQGRVIVDGGVLCGQLELYDNWE